MNKLSTNTKRINCRYDSTHYQYTYTIIRADKEIVKIKVPILPVTKNNPCKISEDSNDFCNGFKVVLMADGKYAYVRYPNELLPYRYDIAGDFNEFGLAMVANDGVATWINESFEHLEADGKTVIPQIEDDGSFYFNGFREINNFSKRKTPLAKVYSEDDALAFVDTEGKLKEFWFYTGDSNDSFAHSRVYFDFDFGTEFNEDDFAVHDSNILFANGYYCHIDNFIDLCARKGLLTQLTKMAEEDHKTAKGIRHLAKEPNKI